VGNIVFVWQVALVGFGSLFSFYGAGLWGQSVHGRQWTLVGPAAGLHCSTPHRCPAGATPVHKIAAAANSSLAAVGGTSAHLQLHLTIGFGSGRTLYVRLFVCNFSVRRAMHKQLRQRPSKCPPDRQAASRYALP